MKHFFSAKAFARVAALMLFVMSSVTAFAGDPDLTTLSNAPREGDWKFIGVRTAWYGWNHASESYNGLAGDRWDDVYQWWDGDGTGFTVEGKSKEGTINCVFSLYERYENVPAFAVRRLHWKFVLRTHSEQHCANTALYYRSNLNDLKNMKVDTREDWSDKSGSDYCLAHYSYCGLNGTSTSGEYDKPVDFDNRWGNSEQQKYGAILLTHVVGNGGGSKKNLHEWGGYDATGGWWENIYYKHIYFDANGGSGSMSMQSIGGSGNLKNNAFTRSGYAFTGWNTKADGTGTAYSNQAAINVNSGNCGYTTLYAQWASAPTNLTSEFRQTELKIRLIWNINRDQQKQGTFVIYRNGTQIGTVARSAGQSSFTYDDINNGDSDDFEYDKKVNYEVYYVPSGWNISTKDANLKASTSVETTLTATIKNFEVTCEKDRIVLKWESDGYPEDWGNTFKIYVDNGKVAIDTIIPDAYQKVYRWEHRSVEREGSQNFRDSLLTYYTEQQLNGTEPHDYRLDALINGKVLKSESAPNRAIGFGTQIKYLKATKGDYPGMNKLSWRVNRMGSTASKTYVVERWLAETDSAEWVQFEPFNSDDDNVSYTDDTPLPGVFYHYKVSVREKLSSGAELHDDTTDIGYAQSKGTISGRVTYGSSGMAVSDVNVAVRKISNEQTEKPYHAIQFTNNTGKLKWNYPTKDYAKKIFQDQPFSMQMWINPDNSGRQTFIGFAEGAGYQVYEEEKYVNWRSEKTNVVNYYMKNGCNAIYVMFGVHGCKISVATYNSNPAAYTDYTPVYKTKNVCDTVTVWKVREISSAWTFGTDDADNLTLFGGKITAINGEAPVVGAVYDTMPDIEGINAIYTFEGLKLKKGEFNHVTLTRHADSLTCHLVTIGEDSIPRLLSSTVALTTSFDLSDAKSMSIGGFAGYVDEFRLWTKTLDSTEILNNFDHLLVGNEKNLETYWTFDEGLNTQFFDYARNGAIRRAHDGVIGANAQSSAIVPKELELKAKTDKDGNYIIQGIPFSGEGTTYAVVPTLGVHSFNPSQQLRYISNNSLVHNSTDFDDISSFRVRGAVYYEGTDYPVEGCNLYVDGNVCAKDGELISTKYDGTFEISVPIGAHYIEIRKNGHTFVNNGRYPKDSLKLGTRVNFNQEIDGLTFYDATTVNFTGRVVGGSIEGDKPVGFQLSENNLGVATLTLTPKNSNRLNLKEEKNGTQYRYVPNDKERPVLSASPDTIRSTAWRGAGQDHCNKIFIRTDSRTGEFSALVPPIEYSIDSIRVASSGLNVISTGLTIDLSDPTTTNTDSVKRADSTMQYYNYHTLLRQTYHSSPVFTVAQDDNEIGAFGIKSYKIKDASGELAINNIYSADEAGKITYKYGSPLFEMEHFYTFNIKGYEEYVNMDGQTPDTVHVPLADVVVTINNALSAEQAVYGEGNPDNAPAGSVYNLQSNQLTLDADGEATYQWMAGLPNIVAPYSRSLDISYEVDGVEYPWRDKPFTGIILGDLLTGSNFVTEGPDQVDMVLRDPPGSQSFATWETGSVTNYEVVSGSVFEGDEAVGVCVHSGATVTAGAGVGVFTITENSLVADLEVGLQLKIDSWEGKTARITTTVTKAISTSNLPEYDGAEGDVFIGRATNLIFGKSRKVGLYRDTANQNNAVIGLKDAISVSSKFKTSFAYSQHYIVHDLLPNLAKMRDNTSNADSIQHFNTQIALWKQYLADNEFDKILAFEKKDNITSVDYTNYSFDAGSSVTSSKTQETSKGIHTEYSFRKGFYIDGAFGGSFNKFGVELRWNTTNVWGTKTDFDADTTNVATFSYTLKDNDPDDAISVDVYDFKREIILYRQWKEAHPKDTTYDSYVNKIIKNNKKAGKDTVIITKTGIGKYASPIFRTRGGQTSNPYEGRVVAQYDTITDHLGATLMEATMQVEVPQIEAVPKERVNVTSGTAANFSLELGNASEVDADCVFRLFVDDNTNPNGAQLLIDGMPLTDGRLFRVPAGQTVYKSLQLKQSNPGILKYENIGIILASVGQSDPMSKMPIIADTTHITAHFVASSSPVTMELSTTTMNTQTGTSLTVTMKDFDRNFYNLKAFRMQYKPQGGNWNTFREYLIDTSDPDKKLPKDAIITHTLNMNAYSDGEYTFRIVSVSNGSGGEIYVYSDEQTLIKDTSRPRPLGLPEPADGILDIGDEISVTFNETILRGELATTRNFLVTGVLNGAEVAHNTALRANDGITAPAASTEAAINLANADFSLDAWLYIQSNGTILRHGTGNKMLTIGTDKDSLLVVRMNSQTFTSTKKVPHNQWLFFTLSNQVVGENAILSAAIAYDSSEELLLDGVAVPRYEGNGPLTIGCGAGFAMHELLLWDNARDLVTALQQRSVTKNPATRHLAGYWKLNEGEGTFVRDYARNRHITMTGETWYMNNVNKAIELDGTETFIADVSSDPSLPGDDFAAEFWVRCGQQTDTATLFHLGEVSLWLDLEGQLYLQSGEQSYLVNRPIVNNEWHHIALNILRLGTAAVYIDGERALTINASEIGSFAAAQLRMGEKLVGGLDEIRIWHATMSADLLAANRKVRLNGDELGLSRYYPFEKKDLDEYHQVITFGTLEDQSGHGGDATINYQLSNINYTDDSPALREKLTETNVPFTFTASDNKIVIDIDIAPSKIEGCTLHFTVDNVRDVNGNYSVPATWSAFVHRGELSWADEALEATQPVKTSTTLTTAIANRSGKAQMWEITNIPSWLIVSPSSGTLNPLEQTPVTFTVRDATAIGRYEHNIYLSSTGGIDLPLTIRLTVTGDVPEWSVNPKDYPMSMNIIGQLDMFGVTSEDPDDVIAAFINDTCRGIAHPEYKERYDGWYITMPIYGDSEKDKKKQVTFRAYDASSGTLYPVVTATPSIQFYALSRVGTYTDPVILSLTDYIEQNLALSKGWNWISFYVTTDDMAPLSLLEPVLADALAIKGQNKALVYSNGVWEGDLTLLDNTQMFSVKMAKDRNLRLVGHSVAQGTTFAIAPNWNWLGYYGRQVADVTDALAAMTPSDLDMILSQWQMAYYDDYEWAGSLNYLEPGIGYIVYSTNGSEAFSYPSAALAAAPARAQVKPQITNNKLQTEFLPVDYHLYPYNMTLLAQVTDNGAPVADAELGVFVGDECRATGVTNSNGKITLSIPGDETLQMILKVAANGHIYENMGSLEYVTDAIIGVPEPLRINIHSTPTGIDQTTNDQSQTSNAHKVLHNGLLYILRNGKTYNAQGAEVK